MENNCYPRPYNITDICHSILSESSQRKNRHMKNLSFLLLLAVLVGACVEPIHDSFDKLPPGVWRGVLILDQKSQLAATDEEVSYKSDFSGELPFNFDVVYDDANNITLRIHNAEETIVATDITYNRDKATAKDTIRIDFPDLDTYITAIYEEDIMEGSWHVPYKGSYTIPFKAYHGQSHRFTTLKKEPVADLSGKWETLFEVGTEDEYLAIGEFNQKGNMLIGTFLTETGDYRYLQGTVQGDKLFLSCFDAAHAFLFEGKVLEDGTITGFFRSGRHYTSAWSAKKNPDAKLTSAFALTTVTDDSAALDFTFPNLDGEPISLSDPAFADKVKLVKLTGTWCPNCKDETAFLKQFFIDNPMNDVEVIEIAFEYYEDESKAIGQLKTYKEKLGLPFTMLYGGLASKKVASEKLPQLSGVTSFPTLLFVDRDNKIQHVHTGFAGPATSEYANFKADFARLLAELRAS